MSLFIRVEIASKLLGSKSPNDIMFIALDRVHKIQSTGGERGCIIFHGQPTERTVVDVTAGELVANNIVDTSFFAIESK